MQMTYFFGTSIQTINENYLHNKQDKYRKWLKERKLQNGELKPTYNEIQQEKHQLETEYEERFKQMEQRFEEKMKIMDSGLARATRRNVPGYPSKKIIEDYQRLKMGLEFILNKMVVDRRPKTEIEEIRKLISRGLA